MIDLPSHPKMLKRDEDGEIRCTRTGKRVATIDELSASYGRGLIRARLAAERAQAELEAKMSAPGARPATPRPHGRSGRHRLGGGRAMIR